VNVYDVKAVHTYAMASIYKATVTIFDVDGVSAVAVSTITVKRPVFAPRPVGSSLRHLRHVRHQKHLRHAKHVGHRRRLAHVLHMTHAATLATAQGVREGDEAGT
jgi:hypothetical protein